VPTLEPGRIVWAELSSSDGTKKKCRPGVIITSTNDIKSGQPLFVVAATTKFTEPLAEDQVRLPWHPQGQVRTRLCEPTVAVCTWLCEIQQADIVRYGGVVPPKTMGQILDVLDRLE
jgi:hypothetical protein